MSALFWKKISCIVASANHIITILVIIVDHRFYLEGPKFISSLLYSVLFQIAIVATLSIYECKSATFEPPRKLWAVKGSIIT